MGQNPALRIGLLLAVQFLSMACPAFADEASRLKWIHRPVSLVKGNFQLEDQGGGFVPTPGFKLIATAAAPTFPGDPRALQSSSFAVQGTTAFVGYMMADEVVHGAIDILDLKDLGAPGLIRTVLFDQEEFTALEARGSRLFAVGTTSRGAGGAVLVVFDVSDLSDLAAPESPAVLSRTELGGFSATSIALDGKHAVVSAGDNSGVSLVDISDPVHPVVEGFIPVSNSLDAVRHGGELFVLGGGQATDLFSLLGPGLNFLARVSQIPTPAPGKMRIEGHHLFTNAGKSGLHVFDVSQPGTVKVVYQGELSGTGNGLDVVPGFGFLAQGDAGVHVMDLADRSKPLGLGSIDFGEDRGSANHIRVRQVGGRSVVFLGDGLGGFKILEFSAGLSIEAVLRHCLFGDEHLDGTLELRGAYPVRIPEELRVTDGNAGKGQATLKFGDVECLYRGASDCPSPVPFTESWEKGLRFKFESCSNGAQAGGTVLTGSRVQLQIDQSPWLFALTTRARAEIQLHFDPAGGNP